MKTYLKWAGRKDTILGAIAEKFHGECDRWIEPFAGSLSVFLDQRTRQGLRGKAMDTEWLLNDRNEVLVTTHLAVRDQHQQVLLELSRLPSTAVVWRESYGKIRDEFNEELVTMAATGAVDPKDQPGQNHAWLAARLIWLNRACFNGLWRTNKSGKFNVPIGSYTSLTLPGTSTLLPIGFALRNTTITSCGFSEFLQEALAKAIDERTWVYADPPYVPISETSSFVSYTKEGFSSHDQIRLANLLSEIAAQGGQVVASNHDVPFVRQLYGDLGFRIEAISVKRSIAANGKKRGKVGEVLLVKGPR